MVGAFPELEEEVKLFPEILINLMSRGWNLCPNIRMQLVILFLHLFINALRCLKESTWRHHHRMMMMKRLLGIPSGSESQQPTAYH